MPQTTQKKQNNCLKKRIIGFISVVFLFTMFSINLINASASYFGDEKNADEKSRKTTISINKNGWNNAHISTDDRTLEFVDNTSEGVSDIPKNSSEQDVPNLSGKTSIGEIYEHIPPKPDTKDITTEPKPAFSYKNPFIASVAACILLFFFVVFFMVLIAKRRKGGTESEEDIYKI